jgi:hypothetical protein
VENLILQEHRDEWLGARGSVLQKMTNTGRTLCSALCLLKHSAQRNECDFHSRNRFPLQFEFVINL